MAKKIAEDKLARPGGPRRHRGAPLDARPGRPWSWWCTSAGEVRVSNFLLWQQIAYAEIHLYRDPLAGLRRARPAPRHRRLPAPRAPLRQDLRPAPHHARMNDKNRNLAVRLTTAFVLLPLVLWLIWLGGLYLAVLLWLAAAGCACGS